MMPLTVSYSSEPQKIRKKKDNAPMVRPTNKLTAAFIRLVKHPIITPILIAFLILLVASNRSAQEALVLINDDLWSQIWRIFGTHLVHVNLPHALSNILGLFLITFIFKDLFNNRLLFNVILISALF